MTTLLLSSKVRNTRENVILMKTENVWAFYEATFCFSAGSYELQVPENHKVNEKIGVLELEDRDQLQNKEPTFIIPNDISRVFGIELSPNKDGNLMLRKVGRWGRFSIVAYIGAKFYVFYAPKVSFVYNHDYWWGHRDSPSPLITIFNTASGFTTCNPSSMHLVSQTWLPFTLPADEHLFFFSFWLLFGL